MPVITIYLEIPGKKPISIEVTDSVPLRLILPGLNREVPELPDSFELSLKLSNNKSLAECGVKDGDTLTVTETAAYVRRK